MRGPLVAALERHLLVYGAGEIESRRLIAELAEEVLRDLEEDGWGFPGVADNPT